VAIGIAEQYLRANTILATPAGQATPAGPALLRKTNPGSTTESTSPSLAEARLQNRRKCEDCISDSLDGELAVAEQKALTSNPPQGHRR
jgi:hypothetical protein